MSSDSKRGRLPFEPRKKNKNNKSESAAPPTSTKGEKTIAAKSRKQKSTSRNSRPNSNLSAIPDAVSKRMGRRMAVFCGIPSVLGMSSLFIFYWIRIKDVIELPPFLPFAISFGFLGLGVLGLSYGLFSACWDEERTGTVMGVDEFKTNLGRTRDAWKASKEANAD